MVDSRLDPGIHPAQLVARENGHHRIAEEAVFIVSSGLGFVGGNDSSNAAISPREFIPKTSSVLGEIDITMLEEGWHSC